MVEITAEIIAGFSASVLQQDYDQAVSSPPCHMEWWEACASQHPKVAIAAPRRHAKSTAVTLAYVLTCVLFRNRKYVLIVSDTITQATQFLGEIKKQLTDNEKIQNLFGIASFEKDTEDDCIVTFKDGEQFRISAKGSEQKMRGLKWDNKRPDLIVGDDLENDEIVLNSERRTKFKRWFYGALIPCLSSNGLIRIVGTILHEDSLLNNLMPSLWHADTVETPLKVYSKQRRPSWRAMKYKAHTEDFTQILWTEKYTKEWFISERADFAARGLLDVYSQEFLNEPIDDSVAYFKKQDFTASTQEDKKRIVHNYIAVDLAISKEQTADYSVFLVVGMDEQRILYVKNVIRERLDGREIVDMLMSLNDVYKPEIIGIEEMQVSKAIGPFLREEMNRTGKYLNLLPLKHGGKDKIARARSIQARMRAGGVRFDKSADWYPIFEDELCKFPRATKDDQVDAFAYVGIMLDSLTEAPTKQEQEDEQYYDDLAASRINADGRSSWTGY
jgi:predicted phage terminase large subunit-like protein